MAKRVWSQGDWTTWVSLAAGSIALGIAGCAGEDEPDLQPFDAAPEVRRDVAAPTPDVSVDARPDAGQPDRQDSSVSEASVDASEAGTTICPNPVDAARDDALIAAGRALVESLRCANCHQDQPLDAGLILSGRLLTPIVPDSAVYPRNLTPDPQTGLGCWTDPQIANAILNGIGGADRELCRMPKFASRIDGGGAQQIAAFLRSLPAVSKEIPLPSACPMPPVSDGGVDGAAPDARGDVSPPPDGGNDGPATPPDGGPDGGADGTTVPDGGTDATEPDAGSDGGPSDSGLDVIGDAIANDAELDGAD